MFSVCRLPRSGSWALLLLGATLLLPACGSDSAPGGGKSCAVDTNCEATQYCKLPLTSGDGECVEGCRTSSDQCASGTHCDAVSRDCIANGEEGEGEGTEGEGEGEGVAEGEGEGIAEGEGEGEGSGPVCGDNIDMASAATILAGDTVEDLTCGSDEQAWFAIAMTAGQDLDVTITFDNQEGAVDLDLVAYAPDGETDLAQSAGVESSENLLLSATEDGTHFIVIKTYSEIGAAFTLVTQPLCSADADCEGEGEVCELFTRVCAVPETPACGNDGGLEPNSSIDTASALAVGTLENLTLCGLDYDIYKIELANTATVDMTVAGADDTALTTLMFNADRLVLAQAVANEEVVGQYALSAKFLPAGTYYAVVYADEEDAAATYALTLALTEGSCSGNADCAGDQARVFCQAGVCGSIEGEGTVLPGDPCDSDDDCDSDSVMCWTGGPSADDNMCTVECDGDAACGELMADSYCQTFEDWFGSYSLCVSPCSTDADCAEGLKCNPEGRKCESAPACSVNADCPALWGSTCHQLQGTCGVPAASTCVLETEAEPNETDTTATPLLVGETTGVQLCAGDFDLYRVTLTEASTLTVAMAWADAAAADLDLYLKDLNGNLLASSAGTENSETFTAVSLPIGDYLVIALAYEAEAPMAYTLNTTITAAACTTNADCTADDARKLCDVASGACTLIDGNGALEPGVQCDSSDDCNAETSIGCWTGGPAIDDNMCTVECVEDADCTGLIEGSYCRNLGDGSACVTPCTSSDQCDVTEQCGEAGRCEPRPPCTSDADCTVEGEHCDFLAAMCQPYEAPTCGDDAAQGENGYIAAATVLQTGASLADLNICTADLDWYRVDVTAHQTATVAIAFDGEAVDLDLYAFDANGQMIGASAGMTGEETVELAYLAEGAVYFVVQLYLDPWAGGGTEGTYSLTATIADGAACTVDACDDAAPVLRMTCDETTGTCQSFNGEGAVAIGGLCDSGDDCVEESAGCYNLEGNGQNVCTAVCESDDDCPETLVCVDKSETVGAMICLPAITE